MTSPLGGRGVLSACVSEEKKPDFTWPAWLIVALHLGLWAVLVWHLPCR